MNPLTRGFRKVSVECIDEVLTARREFSILESAVADANEEGFYDSLSGAATPGAILKAFLVKEGNSGKAKE